MFHDYMVIYRAIKGHMKGCFHCFQHISNNRNELNVVSGGHGVQASSYVLVYKAFSFRFNSASANPCFIYIRM